MDSSGASRGSGPDAAVPLVVATGGLAAVFEPFCKEFELVEPYLTLIGLRIAHELVSAAVVSESHRPRPTPRRAGAR